MTDDTPWYILARARARIALRASIRIGDRGAMLRELCRLHGGYLDCRTNEDLNAADLSHLHRFGLRRVPNEGGYALIIDDSPAGLGVDELADVLLIDPNRRQIYPPASPDAILLAHSAFRKYRAPTQKAALRALVTMPVGGTLLVTLPTGAGKSLLFQVAPGIARESGACCVVIVPTVALALAHVESLRDIVGLSTSACIHGDQSYEARRSVYDAFARGEVPILVLSPEIALGDARELLVQAAAPVATKLPGLNAHLTTVYIDEAHIVESWGRSFRPDFQRIPGLLRILREVNPAIRTVLLSATVNEAARAELKRAYGSRDFLAVDAKVNRYEFDLIHARIATAAERDNLVIRLIDRLPRPAIIYTTLVAHAAKLYRAISERGYERIALFTRDIEDSTTRLKVVTDWRSGSVDLVVATSAFGMGIDKEDVRAVIHACVPESPSRYYQEIGRAARDGNQAIALMLWTNDRGRADDSQHARRLWSKSWLTPDMMRKRWEAIMRAAQQNGGSNIVGAHHRLAVPLAAAHDDLSTGDTDYNRDWNRTLLNMLQRSGAVTVMATETRGESAVWHIEIREPRLLATTNDAFWNEITERRSVEREAALSDLDQFEAAISNPDTCISAAIFELVEAGRPLVPPCGRCSFCRANRIAPPGFKDIRFGGLDRIWLTSIGTCRLRPGISVLHPQADNGTISDELIESLVAAGIEQFVVPADDAEAFAIRLAGQPCMFGFVSSHDDIIGDWRLAHLPTAIILESQDRVDRIFECLEAWHITYLNFSLVVVSPPHMLVRGKPISQVLSSSAPIAEAALSRIIRNVDNS